jgi:hypothetical protein
MTTLDEFFSKPADPLSHPRLRNWQARLKQGASATLEVFRPESEFGQAQTEMNLQFTENGSLLPLETVPWDDDLNAGLIHQLHVRAVSQVQEAERFALGLRAAMRMAEREFGDGYFNAVLVDLLKDSDLTTYEAIAKVLKYAYANRPNREGGAFSKYETCREMIAAAISGRARELISDLNYPSDQAKDILVNALARYLDERFTVSKRRRLGLL